MREREKGRSERGGGRERRKDRGGSEGKRRKESK